MEYAIPIGVPKDVNVAEIAPIHGIVSFGAFMTISAGLPESILVISCSGPIGPIFHGVWQSPQPATAVTRYFPRSTGVIEAVEAFMPVSAVFISPSVFVLLQLASEIAIKAANTQTSIVCERECLCIM